MNRVIQTKRPFEEEVEWKEYEEAGQRWIQATHLPTHCCTRRSLAHWEDSDREWMLSRLEELTAHESEEWW